jgi:hypothetical protein
MRWLRRMRRRVTKWLGLALDELRDSWAIAAAEVTGLVTYLFGAPLWAAAVAAGSVLGVRVAAGRVIPRGDEDERPEPPLDDEEIAVAQLICDGYTAEGIARVVKASTDEVKELQQGVFAEVGSEKPTEIREWLRRNGHRPKRPSLPSQIVNSDPVRVTLAIGGLFTFYQRVACPLVNNIWPGLNCP